MIQSRECIVCGNYFPEDQMEIRFTGRRQYICDGCSKEGEKKIRVSHYEKFSKYNKFFVAGKNE